MQKIFDSHHYHLLRKHRLLNHYGKYKSGFTSLAVAVCRAYLKLHALTKKYTTISINNSITQLDLIDPLARDLLTNISYKCIVLDANKSITFSVNSLDKDIREALARKIIHDEWTTIKKTLRNPSP